MPIRSLVELTRAHYIRHPDTSRNPWARVVSLTFNVELIVNVRAAIEQAHKLTPQFFTFTGV